MQTDPTKGMPANKIAGISLLNKFSFESGGVRVWRAYGIGPVRLLSYRDIQVEHGEPTALKVIQPFGPRSQKLGAPRKASVPRAAIFSCNEPSCVLTFKSQEDADSHMDTGNYVAEEGNHKRLQI